MTTQVIVSTNGFVSVAVRVKGPEDSEYITHHLYGDVLGPNNIVIDVAAGTKATAIEIAETPMTEAQIVERTTSAFERSLPSKPKAPDTPAPEPEQPLASVPGPDSADALAMTGQNEVVEEDEDDDDDEI